MSASFRPQTKAAHSQISSDDLVDAARIGAWGMPAKPKISGSVVAGFPSPAEQYLEPPLDLNELLVKRPAATIRRKYSPHCPCRRSGAWDAASREVAPVRRRGRHHRPLRQGQGILRSALAYARLGSLESRAPLARRLRPGARYTTVAHEAAEALTPPHNAVGRADDGEVSEASPVLIVLPMYGWRRRARRLRGKVRRSCARRDRRR